MSLYFMKEITLAQSARMKYVSIVDKIHLSLLGKGVFVYMDSR